jgi:hypothetical protein
MYEQRYFVRLKAFSWSVPSALLLDDSAGRFTREIWWTNQELPLLISSHHGLPCSYIIGGMNNMPVGGRSPKTWSHPIDMISIIIIIVTNYILIITRERLMV